jgi:heavy metal sensor kinase
MKSWRRPSSLRVRLTLWYTGAMVLVLAVYAASVYAFVRSSVSQTLDEKLKSDFQWPIGMLQTLPNGDISFNEQEGETDSSTPWLQVWSPSGELKLNTFRAKQNPIPLGSKLVDGAPSIVRVPNAKPPVRVMTGTSHIGGQPVVVQVAEEEKPIQEELRKLSFVLLLGFPLGVAVAGIGGYSLARRVLAPVERMAERARLITAERLRDRLPVDNPDDELGRLATVFNETLTRLESSFEQMRRFTADASHELRTPLTAMRSVGEVGLRGKRDEPAYREIIGSMLEEVDRLSHLVDRLLTMSRADMGDAPLSVDAVDLCELAEEVASQLDVLAEEKQQSLTVERRATLRWMGDRLVLRQALLNLVDNAIKYSPTGGRITIRIDASPEGAVLDVSDTGPGIPAELHARIFDRFYRVDTSRSRENGGSGLGLSIAKWAVEVNGGRLALIENTAGVGSTFRIVLPQASLKTLPDRNVPSSDPLSVRNASVS